jgi:hypothetical protein
MVFNQIEIINTLKYLTKLKITYQQILKNKVSELQRKISFLVFCFVFGEGSYYVAQDDLEFESSCSAFPVLGLQVCALTSN